MDLVDVAMAHINKGGGVDKGEVDVVMKVTLCCLVQPQWTCWKGMSPSICRQRATIVNFSVPGPVDS
jgi:hypothetical protein